MLLQYCSDPHLEFRENKQFLNQHPLQPVSYWNPRTSIGFGDITPNSHVTKLLTSFLGVTGQFYSVVLVGILITKFTSSNSNNQ